MALSRALAGRRRQVRCNVLYPGYIQATLYLRYSTGEYLGSQLWLGPGWAGLAGLAGLVGLGWAGWLVTWVVGWFQCGSVRGRDSGTREVTGAMERWRWLGLTDWLGRARCTAQRIRGTYSELR
ncbi:hypothetical protein GGR52DRAFT_331568 [Hypoxylon sp. FL1284]|nr:hypothetical protein GGR52DRAFT_331568 [Hypoxylon sp. FL1284]